MNTGRVILFPSLLAPVTPDRVLPAANIALLREVKYFVVEELRTARRFLKSCDKAIEIDSLHFDVLNEHTPAEAVEGMLAPALAVADPGADLVAAAQRRGIEVVPLVGPSSILLALMASGFNGQSFTFEGYLPIDAGRRAEAVNRMIAGVRRHHTHIFIETPYRNNRLVGELAAKLPAEMLMCVAVDITGPTQNIRTMTARCWRTAKYDYDKRPAIFLVGSSYINEKKR